MRLLQDVVRVRPHLDDGVRVGPHLYDDLDVTKNKVGKNRLVNHHNNNKFTKNLAYFQVPSKHLHLKKKGHHSLFLLNHPAFIILISEIMKMQV